MKLQQHYTSRSINLAYKESQIHRTKSGRKWLFLSLSYLLLSVLTVNSYAKTYYVDQSCANQGDGYADQCAISPGGSGAYLDAQDCFSAVRAGDTCLIKNGTYVTNYRTNTSWYEGGFHVAASGTANARITIKNYPGHKPKLANCSATDRVNLCDIPTITAPSKAYITFEGFIVLGGMSIWGDRGSPSTQGNIIRNVEIIGGWGGANDGNWSGLFLKNQTGLLAQGNYIHDLIVQNGGGQQSSASCIKIYYLNDSFIEYNTCKNVFISSAAGGIDDKENAVRNALRYNWIENVPTGIRINNQLSSTGEKVYGNIVRCASNTDGSGILLLTNIDGIDVYNNTFYDCSYGLSNSGGSIRNARYYNNIVVARLANTQWYTDAAYSNYNIFSVAKRYRVAAGWRSSLTEYKLTGFDNGSSETDCRFLEPGRNYRLKNDSDCLAYGRENGLENGDVIEVGAYGLTQCVGHICFNNLTQPLEPKQLVAE